MSSAAAEGHVRGNRSGAAVRREDAAESAPLSSPTVRRAATLLDWQLWCFGRDIHAPGGNLLLARGFERHRPTRLGTGTAAYALECGPGCRIIAWGFGLFYGDDAHGGVFLRRHGFLPRLVPSATVPMPAWLPAHIAPARSPRDGVTWAVARRLAAAACEALAAYERFAVDAAGAGHRICCAAERPRRMRRTLPVPPQETAAAWLALADTVRSDDRAPAHPFQTAA